ncbi:MAG TPA: hypothetical protein DGR97_05865, partial [Gammaproteobacteria bacterium]|nr:hypothetical protein [Gammaproteobacteria bacterium]
MSQIGRYTPAPSQEVIYGKPVAEALVEEIERQKVSRIVFVTNTSLNQPNGLAEVVKGALGKLCVAEVSGIRAHSPREDVVRLTTTLRNSNADMVIALGGGSVCDATKAACL